MLPLTAARREAVGAKRRGTDWAAVTFVRSVKWWVWVKDVQQFDGLSISQLKERIFTTVTCHFFFCFHNVCLVHF
jgi:hypothetical protein